MSRRPYIVHLAECPGPDVRRVSHRATGRLLGTVGRHWGNTLEGLWSTWGPLDDGTDGAIGDVVWTMHEAIEENLLCSAYHRPVYNHRLCSTHASFVPQRWRADCPDCESRVRAIARSRRELAAEWAHYLWLLKEEQCEP